MKIALRALLTAAVLALAAGCDKEIREARIPDRIWLLEGKLYNADGSGLEFATPTVEETAHGPWERL
jgi:hypothetical protein